jgi:hypothetical protein
VRRKQMAFRKTADLVTNNSNTYANIEEWIAEHGRCGLYNDQYITAGTMDVNEAGNGVRIVLTYIDEANATAHREAFASEIEDRNYTSTVISEETI